MRPPPGRLPLVEPIAQAPVFLGVELKSFRNPAVNHVLLDHKCCGKHGERGRELSSLVFSQADDSRIADHWERV